MFISLFGCRGDRTESDNRYSIIDIHIHIESGKYIEAFDYSIKRFNIAGFGLVGSPSEIFSPIQGEYLGFSTPEKNNLQLLKISNKNSTLYYSFATYSPVDKNIVKKLKEFIKNGGTGLKLYNGHYDYYNAFNIRLDTPHMMEVFKFCEKERIPVMFHVNSRLYWPELKNILDAYPDLNINLPHYCMSLIDISLMEKIFKSYPHVVTDISLGSYWHAYPAFKFISDRALIYRKLIQKHKARFMFGTDMVLSDKNMDEKYIADKIKSYIDFLEKKQYISTTIKQYCRDHKKKVTPLNGLFLDSETLHYIYEINAKRFLQN